MAVKRMCDQCRKESIVTPHVEEHAVPAYLWAGTGLPWLVVLRVEAGCRPVRLEFCSWACVGLHAAKQKAGGHVG